MNNDLLNDFQTVGRELVNQHLVSARGGNMSIRFPDGRTVITRHDSLNGFLTDRDFAWFAPNGSVQGPEPSSDTPVHLAIYAANGAGAIVHAHPRHAVALSLTRTVVRPVNLEGQLHLIEVPVIPAGMAAEVAGPVASALDGHRICLVQGHGCYAFAPDLWTAFQWVTVLEEASQIIYLMESLTAKH